MPGVPAWIATRIVPGAAAEAEPPFTGAYDDFAPLLAAFGVRRLLGSYSGSLIRLRRDSDDVEANFGYITTEDETNGDLDAAAIATWLGAATGYVVTWYDQSGNGNHATQATTSKQPQYTADGYNDKPGILSTGTAERLSLGSAIIPASGIFSALIACEPVSEATVGYLFGQYQAAQTGRMAWRANTDSGGSASAGDFALLHHGAADGAGTGGQLADAAYNGAFILRFANSGEAAGVEWQRDADPIDTATWTAAFTGQQTSLLRDHPDSLGAFDGEVYEVIVSGSAWDSGDSAQAFAACNDYWQIWVFEP